MVDEQYQHLVAVAAALSTLFVLSALLERALAVLFEHGLFQHLTMRKSNPSGGAEVMLRSKWHGTRGTIALAISLIVCFYYSFDALAVVFSKGADPFGIAVTGFVVAGGSAGVITIVQGFLKFDKETREALIEANKAEARASADVAKFEAEAREAMAKAAKVEAEAKELTAKATKLAAELRVLQDEGALNAAKSDAGRNAVPTSTASRAIRSSVPITRAPTGPDRAISSADLEAISTPDP